MELACVYRIDGGVQVLEFRAVSALFLCHCGMANV